MSPADERELRERLHEEYERVLAGCTGKQLFPSHDVAMRRIHNEDTRKTCRPYRCQNCDGWHIGSRGKLINWLR